MAMMSMREMLMEMGTGSYPRSIQQRSQRHTFSHTCWSSR